MTTFPATLRREFRVAFSKRAQPVWFRIVKWLLLLTAVVAFRQKPLLWWCLLSLLALGLAVHFFYRWKTRTWTRPWGGWNDLDSGRC